jgi:Bacterial PH domain
MFPLQENEKVEMYVRRHWVWLAIEVLKSFIIFILPVSLSIYLSTYVFTDKDLFFNYSINSLLSLFVYIWAIFSWIYFADRFTKYALNFWVLTNKRLVESEHIMLFSRKLSTLPLETIEDVTVKYDGLLENVIGFGSLTVQTAGTQREFLADDINDPEDVKQAIFRMREGIKNNDRIVTMQNSEELADDIGEAMIKSNLNDIYEKEVHAQAIDIPHDFALPSDQVSVESVNKTSTANIYDWAHVNDKQKNDMRNVNEQITINDKFKEDIGKALRYE